MAETVEKSKARSGSSQRAARSRKLRHDTTDTAPGGRPGRKARGKRGGTRRDSVLASATVHRSVSGANEDQNAGTEAADFGAEAAEGAVRVLGKAVYSAKLNAHRRLEVKGGEPVPQGTGSNPASKLQQKHNIKREYAAAKRGADGVRTASEVGKSAENAARKGEKALEKAADFVREHYKSFLLIGAIGLLCMGLVSLVSSCSAFAQGGANVLGNL